MNKLVLAAIVLFSGLTIAQAARHRQSDSDVYVGGYTKDNGTYVEPHYRSAPNANKWDNYDYKPSQPQYNDSNTNTTPNPGRFNDSNPYNDAPGYGRK